MMSLEPIETSLGWAIHGDNLFRGRSVGRSMIGTPFWNLLSLSMDGPKLSSVELQMMDCICTTMLVADPRIWPLKVAWLSGSYGSVVAGFSASQVYFAQANVGPPPTARMATALCELSDFCAARSDAGDALRDWWELQVAAHERVPGFGVAGRAVDERIAQVRAASERLGLADRPYARLQRRLALLAREGSQLEENVAGVYAASFLDLGFTAEQVLGLMMAITMVTLWGSAWESSRAEPAQLRNLPPEYVHYVGQPWRASPRQLAQRDEKGGMSR